MNGLTKYLCDLIAFQMGKLSPDEIRTRWRAGKYTGVRREDAAEYAKLHGMGEA